MPDAGGALARGAGRAACSEDIEGIFIVAPTGLAGRLGGTVNLAGLLPASVTVTGAFSLEINKASSRVTESVTLAGTTVSLDVPAGPFVRVAGTGIVINIAGQSLTGDVAFERTASTTKITIANASLRLGDGTTDFVVLSNGTGDFTLGGTAAAPTMIGSLSVDVAVLVPQVSLTGTLSLQVEQTSTARTLRVGGTGVALVIAGQRLLSLIHISEPTRPY